MKNICAAGLLLLLSSIPWSDSRASTTFTLEPYQRQITLTGFTYPRLEVTISSEVNGRCLIIHGDIGETIAPDGRLAEIDPTFVNLQLEANNIARERVRRELAQQEKTLARFTTLRSQQSTPQAQLDEVTLAVDLLRNRLEELDNARAELNETLTRHTIGAPAGYRIIELFAEAGEYLQRGQPVARVGDFRQLITTLALSYSELLMLGQSADLQLLLPELAIRVPATIYRTSPVFDPATRKIRVDLLIEPQSPRLEQPLRGGMRTEITLTSGARSDSFLVPVGAIENRYEGQWLIRENGSRQQVLLLGTDDESMAIVSGPGLAAGQKYLLNPGDQPGS